MYDPFIMQKKEEGGIPMAGRKPKPTAVKKLEGNPGKRKLNSKEPVPAKGIPACPDWLMPEAKKEWERLAELMNQMGVLTEVDMAAFAAYCQSYARWKEFGLADLCIRLCQLNFCRYIHSVHLRCPSV